MSAAVFFLVCLQIEPLGLIVACKERSKRIACPLVVMGMPSSPAGSEGPTAISVAVEPFTMYLKVCDNIAL